MKEGEAPVNQQAGGPGAGDRTVRGILRLLEIMAVLRDPVRGCPWDLKQTFASIAPYTVEEAYEVADAIERGDMNDLKDELGDLLLQVVYHARIGEEAGLFAFPDVVEAISAKMIRRHPHVFGDGPAKADDVSGQWEAIKKAEREAKAFQRDGDRISTLFDDIPSGLPAATRSAKIQRRAARLGFDWPSVEPILDKVDEELLELRVEIANPADAKTESRQFEEFGDVLFVLVNLGLRLGIDSEAALRSANVKFIRRMAGMEAAALKSGHQLQELSLDEMQALWDRAKAEERGGEV